MPVTLDQLIQFTSTTLDCQCDSMSGERLYRPVLLASERSTGYFGYDRMVFW